MSVQKISSSLLESTGITPAWDATALTGISTSSDFVTLKTNVALNFFLDAVDSSRSIQNLADGFVDGFEDQTGVDDARSAGESYDASGDYYSTISQDSNVKLLITSNSTNNSTTFTDSSPTGRTVTVLGDTKHSTTQKKFGETSIYFDGTGTEGLSVPDSGDWAFSGNFTLECWIKCSTSLTGVRAIMAQGVNGPWSNIGWHMAISAAGAIFFETSNNGSNGVDVITSGASLKDDAWHHIACVRNSNTFTIYVDGISRGSNTGTITVQNRTEPVTIGHWTPGNSNDPFLGYIDDIRISNVARYTANFTAPTNSHGFTYTAGQNMTLISESETAATAPEKAYVTLFNEPVDSLTLNTDIMAWVSRSTKTVTATNASNVLNATSHGMSNGGRVMLSTTGTTTLQEMTHFDGGSDWLNIAEGTLGATDGKSFTICFYIRMLADSTTARILSTTNGRFNINLSTNNAIYFLMRDSSNNTALNGDSAASLKVADGLTHVAISIDAANSTGHIRLNNDSAIALSVTNRTIDITQADFVIGDTTGGGGVKINADIGRFYLTQEYIDISNNTNLAKFIDADNNPVDMGADGSTPSGNQPLIFLNNAFGTFQTNAGSGGNFTENGTLTQGTNLTETDLPAGLSTLPIYHVVNKTANTFQVAATNGGAAVTFSDDGTGTHSARSLTSVTLADKGDYGTGKAILAGTADITGQPTGTDVRLIVQTKNNKETNLHGTAVQYGKKDA